MKQRWLAVGILTAALFAVNGLARLIVWQAGIVDDTDQILAGLLASVVAALLCVVAGVRWAYLYPLVRVVSDLGAAILAASLLGVVVGPYLGGSTPLVEGFGFALRQFVFFVGVFALAASLGVLPTITAGQDWRSRALREHERRIRRRPRRVP